MPYGDWPPKDPRGVDVLPASEQRGNNLKSCKGFYLKAQDLVVTVLHVPYPLETGLVECKRHRQWIFQPDQAQYLPPWR